jgi:Ni/Fe-hydrogenase 1 B-type cytochrome subunit
LADQNDSKASEFVKNFSFAGAPQASQNAQGRSSLAGSSVRRKKERAVTDATEDDLAAQRALLFSEAAGARDVQETQVAVLVYEVPIRLWHWMNFFSMLALFVTGYLIAIPTPSVGGEAINHFVFGNIRLIHFAAGQIYAWGFLARALFALIGNHTSREIFYVPFWQKEWQKGFMGMLRWYLFMEKRAPRFIGHNPIAQMMMFGAYVLPSFVVIFTGVALYLEPLGMDQPLRIVTDFVFGITGGSLQTHVWHHLAMWLMVIFAILHIYAAVREEIMSRQSMISTMISGWRMFKD